MSLSKEDINLQPGLYIVSTPIGNLRDITLRALDILQSVDTIFCEDSRVTSKLLQAYGIHTSCLPYHEHNAEKMRPKILALLSEGKRLALASDAGTPLISDPGYKLLQSVIERGFYVTPIPGVSSVITSLSMSGLATDKFFFGGFLPAKEGALRSYLVEHGQYDMSTIFFESPHRLLATLHVMKDLWSERNVVVAREMTKMYESFVRGSINDVYEYFSQHAPRGEIVLLLEGFKTQKENEDIRKKDILSMLQEGMRVKDIAKVVSSSHGLSSKDVYQEILEIKRRYER